MFRMIYMPRGSPVLIVLTTTIMAYLDVLDVPGEALLPFSRTLFVYADICVTTTFIARALASSHSLPTRESSDLAELLHCRARWVPITAM